MCGSTRRPGELAFREEVDVQVGDGFAGVGAVVDHEAVAAGELEFLRELAGDDEEVTELRFIGRRGFADARDGLFRDDEEVDGRLWLDVVDDDAAVVFVFDLRGDFAVDDFLEEGFRHGGICPRNTRKCTKRGEGFRVLGVFRGLIKRSG